KGADKCVPEFSGTICPSFTCDCIVRVLRELVGHILRVKHEDGCLSVDPLLCRDVPAMEPVLHLAVEGMVPDPEVEEEDRKGVQVSLGGWIGRSAYDLRCHVLHRTPDLAARLAVHANV